MPSVSIIIPVYNSSPYLNQCLDSVKEQLLDDFEIICVDDGSTDGSDLILKEYAANDERIKVLYEEHKNAGVARNLGLSAASGRYLYFLDSDDYIESTLLQDCISVADRDDSDIIVFSANQLDSKKKELKRIERALVIKNLPEESILQPFSGKEMPKKLFNSFGNFAWNKMFKRSFVEQTGIQFQDVERANDLAFVTTALALAQRISIIDKPLMVYRTGHGMNLQATKHLAPAATWNAYCEATRRLKQYGVFEQYKQSWLNEALSGLMYCANSMSDEMAKAYVLCLLKFEGEKIFGFLTIPKENYYQVKKLEDYIKLFTGEANPLTEKLDKALSKSNERIQMLQKENRKLLRDRNTLEKERNLILGSRSYWLGRRLTAPYRYLKKVVNRFHF